MLELLWKKEEGRKKEYGRKKEGRRGHAIEETKILLARQISVGR